MTVKTVPLLKAAAELKLSYWAARDAVLRGEIRGWQDARGRWFVDQASVGQAKRRRQQSAVGDPEP